MKEKDEIARITEQSNAHRDAQVAAENEVKALRENLSDIERFLDPSPSPGGDVAWLVKNYVGNLKEMLTAAERRAAESSAAHSELWAQMERERAGRKEAESRAAALEKERNALLAERTKSTLEADARAQKYREEIVALRDRIDGLKADARACCGEEAQEKIAALEKERDEWKRGSKDNAAWFAEAQGKIAALEKENAELKAESKDHLYRWHDAESHYAIATKTLTTQLSDERLLRQKFEEIADQLTEQAERAREAIAGASRRHPGAEAMSLLRYIRDWLWPEYCACGEQKFNGVCLLGVQLDDGRCEPAADTMGEGPRCGKCGTLYKSPTACHNCLEPRPR